jgi:hypothetical protein
VTRSIKIIKQALDKATIELQYLTDEMSSMDTPNADKCRDALHGLHKAASLIREEADELLVEFLRP